MFCLSICMVWKDLEGSEMFEKATPNHMDAWWAGSTLPTLFPIVSSSIFSWSRATWNNSWMLIYYVDRVSLLRATSGSLCRIDLFFWSCLWSVPDFLKLDACPLPPPSSLRPSRSLLPIAPLSEFYFRLIIMFDDSLGIPLRSAN